MAAKKVLFLVGDFAEDYEIMVPFQALEAVGHTVHAICPGKEAGDFVITAIHDAEGYQTFTEKPGHRFTLNATFDEVNAGDYDMLIIPGGRAPEYLRLVEPVLDIVRHFAEANKPIAAVCHGPQLLAAAGILEGKTVTAYPFIGPDLVACGAKLAELDFFKAHVDGNIITAAAWTTHPDWLAKIFEALGTKFEL